MGNGRALIPLVALRAGLAESDYMVTWVLVDSETDEPLTPNAAENLALHPGGRGSPLQFELRSVE